ncbi:hypothetical protein AJ85_16770 [Alkalihalobacillus alcalophilus ATCC 27647 = CGMCC 1.3604]|uniref:Uncharacterized protein n=1 Tax=Alkalihalobacillus alcalophilus ATCC 27647 = CGMCC 1.3604 TaxID=1218173 RepID=A0A4S4JWK8_ALKAL|nr:hypothetical protein AJ85_16770 [Alkalihalobacillus alcalophilus ATCC 27647 = CGMCC 1.3604]
MDDILLIQNLHVSYHGKEVLRNISFSTKKGGNCWNHRSKWGGKVNFIKITVAFDPKR